MVPFTLNHLAMSPNSVREQVPFVAQSSRISPSGFRFHAFQSLAPLHGRGQGDDPTKLAAEKGRPCFMYAEYSHPL